MQKPIILHITPSLMIGGAEKLLVDLLTSFQQHPKNQFEHRVIYLQSGPLLAQIQKLKIQTYHVQGLVSHYDPICFWRLLKLIKKMQPAVLHAMLWTANFYSRLIGKILKIPTICAIHSYYNSGNTTHDHWLKSLLDRQTLHWAHKIVVVSPEIQLKLIQSIPQLIPNQLITIQNGVFLPQNNPKKTLRRTWIIGHVGRLVPVKNQQLLLSALSIIQSKIPHFKAIIIGHGPLELALKNQARQLNLLPFIDFIKTPQAAKYYQTFDCFILPSHQEGQSIALLEAMSWRVTPIVTSTDYKHDLVKHQHNGLICPPNDASSLAQAIISIYENPKFNQQLAQQAYLTVKNNFNLEQVANNYLALYCLHQL